jgi:hypothetical protein
MVAVLGTGLLALVTGTAWAGGQAPVAQEPSRTREQAALTQAQVAQVKGILSHYDPKTLTAADARAIHEAFREAGLRGGPAMREAIEAAGFDFDRLRELAPPPDRQNRQGAEGRREGAKQPGSAQGQAEGASTGPSGGAPGRETGPGRGSKQGAAGQYSLEQAVSDRAQLHTIAFSGLAFLTGDFGASTFIPPGKVCDFFGFQYMRDIDAAGKGHNPIFLNRVAGNVLFILNDQQKGLLEQLALEQAGQLDQLARMRFPVIAAFHRELASPGGLSQAAVRRAVGEIFAFDAALSYRRAEVLGQVATSLTASQKEYLGKMRFGDFGTWPALDERDALRRPGRDRSKLFSVAYMTYASEFFSWYAGSVDADTYFCPERHGTYFGGFYMKDMPAMGKRDFDISTSVTGASGEALLDVLKADQRAPITSIVEGQRKELTEMVAVRKAIAVELRRFLTGAVADRQKVLALGRRYGELDGSVSWMYATAFAKVGRTLTPDQRAALLRLRNLEGYRSAPAYIYSEPLTTRPDLASTDTFFAGAVR